MRECNMKDLLNCLVILMGVILLQACSGEASKAEKRILTIEAHATNNTLFYSGMIQPLKAVMVPSPVDGVVVDMPFQYGERVKKGQLLFVLSSAKFLSDYKAALMQYVKMKSDFNTSQTQLKESDFLHKNELISDDDFKMKQSNYYAAKLALVQAKDTLENLLHQLDIKNLNLASLSISDIDKITQAMHLQMTSENLRILAPNDGIILAHNKSEDETKKTAKGDAVKQGDVLAMIGDMKGISVQIKVNELTVNQLHPGQKIKITGIAFPEEILNGEILRVDRQGESTSGGMPTFTVEVNVPVLTETQQKMIHVGMSAKVEIDLAEKPQIMIPLTALNEKNGEAFVEKLEAISGKKQLVAIKVGKSTMDSIAVLSGLKTGDKIIVSN